MDGLALGRWGLLYGRHKPCHRDQGADVERQHHIRSMQPLRIEQLIFGASLSLEKRVTGRALVNGALSLTLSLSGCGSVRWA